MSKQLRDENNKFVGSEEYFQKLNEKNFAGSLLSESKMYNYYEALCSLSQKVVETIEEVYSDLQKNSMVMPYVSKENRNQTVKYILGMSDLCKIVWKEATRVDKCISILSLSDRSTQLFSRANVGEVDEAVKIIRNGGTTSLSSFDRMEIIRKAFEYNEQTAVKNDAKKAAYLQEVIKGKGTEFLRDIMVKLSYQNKPNDYKGKCGKVLCSAEYIDHLEKHIFGKDIPNYYMTSGGDCAYALNMKSALTSIVRKITRDLQRGRRDNQVINIIHKDNRIRIEYALNNLKLCGCDITDAMETLEEKYPVRDITQNLKELMLRAQYTNGFYDAIPWPMRLTKFVNEVGGGKEYDLKLLPEWSYGSFIYEGQLIDYDGPGNILFGYYGRSYGIPENILYLGAGAAKIMDGSSSWDFADTWFDDPRDQAMVKLGIDFYNEIHNKKRNQFF